MGKFCDQPDKIWPMESATPSQAQNSLSDRSLVGVIIVDHGSRRAESNDMLLEVVRSYQEQTHFEIVEPAHMELAHPSIADAFDRCVARGARNIVVMPYFLLPGRHWHKDIPELSRAAAAAHPGVTYLVTAPLGLDPRMNELIESRIDYCLAHAMGNVPECNVCEGTGRCTLK